jgi:signal transduction histidine kinase
VRLEQLLKSASFRFTAAYVGLFIVSVGILAGLVYFSATSELERTIHVRIAVESDALRAEYARGGTDQLLQAIAERQRSRLIGGLDYALYDGNGKRLFGNLSAVPCTKGWVTFSGPPDGDEPAGELEKLGVLVTPLPNGHCLLVGDDIGKIRKFGSLILDSFGWVLLVTVMLAVAGGIFLSSRVLRRIETINRTAEAIIEGDISRRIPRRGTPDDLDRLAATLNRMLDRMTGLMESLRHISNDVAHDLRTPLGRLRQALEEAGRTASSPDEFRTAIDRAVAEVDGILDTFGAILRIAQIESGSRRSGFQRLLLSELVADVCETYAPSIEDAGKTLRTEIQPDLWIHGDRELLVQSLANLLENAIAHTPAGALVTVSLNHPPEGIELNVADNGFGVSEAERKQIFKRFYRVERSRSAAGNGLGLSIVAAVAELHAAKLSADDNHPGLKIGVVFSDAA